ncbi:MAG: hypothetical protein Q9197_005649, partial [Variospora fuerteventurae]
MAGLDEQQTPEERSRRQRAEKAERAWMRHDEEQQAAAAAGQAVLLCCTAHTSSAPAHSASPAVGILSRGRPGGTTIDTPFAQAAQQVPFHGDNPRPPHDSGTLGQFQDPTHTKEWQGTGSSTSSSTAQSEVISDDDDGAVYSSRMLQDPVGGDSLWHNGSIISSSTGGNGPHRSGKLADALRQGSRNLLWRSGKLLHKRGRRGKGVQADQAGVMSAEGSQTGDEPTHAL